MTQEIGLIGLGAMGCGLARRLGGKGTRVVAWDVSDEGRRQAREAAPDIEIADDVKTLVAALKPPRVILMMITAGQAVDDCLGALTADGSIGPGDVLIDGGNSWFKDTARRQDTLAERGIELLGVGVSGGPQGALAGPSMMAGGSEPAWRRARPLLEPAAAEFDGSTCIEHLGRGAAGHYVKMIHNAVEYALMQALADVAHLQMQAAGRTARETAEALTQARGSLAAGFLLDVTVSVLEAEDDHTARPLIDLVDDRADQTGTGAWFMQEAVARGVAAPSIAAAVEARNFSSDAGFRTLTAKSNAGRGGASRGRFPDAVIGGGLEAAYAAAFLQGFVLMTRAADEFGPMLSLHKAARVWRAGSILQGGMTERTAALETDEQVFETLIALAESGRDALRRLVALGVETGVPVPALSASLTYIDSFGDAPLATRVVQLQRDFFGGHGYRVKGSAAKVYGKWHKKS